MPKLSPARANWPVLEGLKLVNRGKVRDSYLLSSEFRLIVVTDGISARDYVLNALIPTKGIVLNCMTVFWLRMLEGYSIKHHMVACGSDIDKYLPPELRKNADLQSRAMVVRNKKMADAEFVMRRILTGSSVKPYQQTGMVCGQMLPQGLQDGDELPFFMFTPTTKAQEGHDENVSAEEIIKKYPLQSFLASKIFQIAYEFGKTRGILIPDTKFEFAGDGTLADEVLTPDSSRFWSYPDWLKTRQSEIRKAPGSFDKDPVRQWLDAEIAKVIEKYQIKKFDPEIPDCVNIVHNFVMPDSLIRQTTQGYRYIFWRQTEQTIDDFRTEMGIELPKPQEKKILVVLGSDSDLPYVESACEEYGIEKKLLLSCHRNPMELVNFVKELDGKYDAVVCAGGMAFALPGVMDAFGHSFKKQIPVVGVALGKPSTDDLLAAQLSILKIPGQPVIFDEIKGEAYTGTAGFREALFRIQNGELPPPKLRTEKPSRWL